MRIYLQASIAEKEKNVALMMKTHAAQQARFASASPAGCLI